MELHEVLENALRGVQASMAIVKNAQGKTLLESDMESKDDNTIVTAVDRASISAALPYLKANNIPLVSEDGEQSDEIAQYRQFFDPLDGTSPFASGLMTSTVIWGLYDVSRRQIVSSIVGEPVSGRIWFTENGETKLFWVNKNEEKITTQVNKDMLSKKSMLLLDKSHGFKRFGKTIFTDKQLGQLFSKLNTIGSIAIPGSNGLIHALVANGATGVLGSISTALGGPWDACGVLLVINAGGHVKAFTVAQGKLEEKDPLDVESYDCLITANTEENLKNIADSLRQALN
jgi:fructose-1,6-bisphosphatase/inositol monophosphatase family enzyme